MCDFTESDGGIPPNQRKCWVSVLDPQACTQMEWVFRRVRRTRNPYNESRLRVNGCYNPEGWGIHISETRRVSLVSMRKRLRRIRDLLDGNFKRRHSKTKRRRKDVTNKVILDSNTFMVLLDSTMKEKKLSHIDAIVEICRARNLDIESVPELLTSKTKKLIMNEAVNINMIRKKGRKLAI